MEHAQSFCCGYVAVKSGVIKHELTDREIEKRWPQHNIDAFAQGMIDALLKDSYRYRLNKQKLVDEGIIEIFP